MYEMEKYGIATEVTDDDITWHILFACCITMARIQTHTQSMQYVLLVHSNQFHKCAAILRCKYISCLGLWITDYQDNSRYLKYNLQAVAPCPVRTTICVVAMTGLKKCLTLD